MKDLAYKVESDIKKQQHDLGDLGKTMEELKEETQGLQTQFLSSLDKVKSQNESSRQSSFQLQEIQHGLQHVIKFREQLEKALNSFNSR